MKNEQKPPDKSSSNLKKGTQKPSQNHWLVVVIAALLTALTVGGGVYVWQNAKLQNIEEKKQKKVENLTQQIEDLQNQIKKLEEDQETKVPPEESTTTATCGEDIAAGSSGTSAGDTVYCDDSGRMWTITASDEYDWENAVGYCDNLTYGGYSDWKLPSCESGSSGEGCLLYEFGMSVCDWRTGTEFECTPSWDPNAQSRYYWSSTESQSDYHASSTDGPVHFTDCAWYVIFSNGHVVNFSKSYSFSVRCVRGQ